MGWALCCTIHGGQWLSSQEKQTHVGVLSNTVREGQFRQGQGRGKNVNAGVVRGRKLSVSVRRGPAKLKQGRCMGQDSPVRTVLCAKAVQEDV